MQEGDSLKICSKCGAYQKDNRYYCIDCNEKLGDRLSQREQESKEKELKEKSEKYYKESDGLSVTTGNKIVGFCSLIGIIVIVILITIYSKYVSSVQEAFLALVFFISCTLEALFPKIIWSIEKFRLSFTINIEKDTDPSDFYLFMRKIIIYMGFVIALILLISSITVGTEPDVTLIWYTNTITP